MATELMMVAADSTGKLCVTTVWLDGLVVDPDGGEAVAVFNAINGISDLGWQAREVMPRDEDDFGAAVAGDYEDIGDKVTLEFALADGSLARYRFPCPAESIFMPDLKTVDTANAAVAALVAQFVATVKGTNGQAITSLIRGYRSRNNSRRTR